MHNLHTVIVQSMASFLIFLLFVIRNPQAVIRKGKKISATGTSETGTLQQLAT
jgi:hypothetical protein